MLKLIEKLIVKRRHLVFGEADLIRVLNVINKHKDNIYICDVSMSIDNCGWRGSDSWFVHFNASEKAWQKIVNDLNVIRVWQCRDIPKNCNGKVYSED